MNKKSIAKKEKQYREVNKTIVAERLKRSYETHKEDRLEKCKEYRKKNKEALAKYSRQRYETHKEEIRMYKKQYYKTNKEKLRFAKQRYKARKRQLPSTLTAKQWEQIKEYFNNSCAYCGKEKPLAQDHFIPLSKGGEYTKNNIIPACKSCNSSKATKYFQDWYPKYRYYSKKREKIILEFLEYKDNEQQLSII